MFFNNDNVQLEMSMVIRNLGYNSMENIPEKILKEIKSSIKEVKDLIQPKIIWEEHTFEIDEINKKIKLSNNLYIEDEHIFHNLCKADKLVIGIGTLGSLMDEKANKFIDEKKVLKAIIYEAIGETALNQASSDFRFKLVKENEANKIGVTRGFYPGTNQWNLEDQKIIFSLLKGSKIGVKLNEGYMMTPKKSFSVVYGLGKEIKTVVIKNKCMYCNLTKCRYRNLDVEALM